MSSKQTNVLYDVWEACLTQIADKLEKRSVNSLNMQLEQLSPLRHEREIITAKNLGLIMDSHLTYDQHITEVVSSLLYVEAFTYQQGLEMF